MEDDIIVIEIVIMRTLRFLERMGIIIRKRKMMRKRILNRMVVMMKMLQRKKKMIFLRGWG